MLRVVKIINIQPNLIDCELNNGVKKRIDLNPLLQKQGHFKGIDQLKNVHFLEKARIGECGEIYWKDAITTSNNQKWNYDISPEIVDFYGESI
jgi:hypothetical protein